MGAPNPFDDLQPYDVAGGAKWNPGAEDLLLGFSKNLQQIKPLNLAEGLDRQIL